MGEDGGGMEGLRMGQQAVSLKWKPGQDVKWTRAGRGRTVRQGAILLLKELEEIEKCLSVHACVCACLRLLRGEPQALTEGFDDAISW